MLHYLSGPFVFLKKSKLQFILAVFLIALLTLLSQVGGIILWIFLPLSIRIASKFDRFDWVITWSLLIVFYTISAAVIIPIIAKPFGRVPLPCFSSHANSLTPRNSGYCILMRNYVRPELKAYLIDLSKTIHARYPNTKTIYLDANLPFFDGFPLIPHLSHNDGKKVDLAFFYRNSLNNNPVETPSPIGYGIYVPPRSTEMKSCTNKKTTYYLRWDFNFLQPFNQQRKFDLERTRYLISKIFEDKRTQAFFLENHLLQRLGFSPAGHKRLRQCIAENDRTCYPARFQGCRAGRHDDHVHVQIW